MAVERAADLISMFAATDWGVNAIYRNKGKRFGITGIFDNNYVDVDVAEVEFASSTPIFTIPTAALPCDPAIGDTLVIDCNSYTIRNFKADGTGVTTLHLQVSTD